VNWLDIPKGRAGIMIDEFLSGEINEQLGQALLDTRRQAFSFPANPRQTGSVTLCKINFARQHW
jgi:hypothetical protein